MALADIRTRAAGEAVAATRLSRMEGGPRDVEVFEAPIAPRLVARWEPPVEEPEIGPELTSASSLLVTLRPGIHPDAADSLLRNVVVPERPEDERLRVTPLVPRGLHLIEWEAPDGATGDPPGFLLDRAARIADEEVVDRVGLDHLVSKLPLGPTTQLLESLPRPERELRQMGVPKVWKKNIVGSPGIRVGVVDSGVDTRHEHLNANLYRPNGHVVGWGLGRNPSDFEDDNGHGTFCSGLIGSTGGHGVNLRVSIIPIKFLNAEGYGTVGDAIRGIGFALQQGANVISCSWGSASRSLELKAALERAHEAGALVVAGAGNSERDLDEKPFYPAAFRVANMISVGACDDDDRPVPVWGYGRARVHVTAPGATVYSTAFGNGSTQLGGTSASAAFVAGACALLMAAKPDLEPLQVRERIIQSVAPLRGDEAKVKGSCCSRGRLDVANAVFGESLDPNLICPGE